MISSILKVVSKFLPQSELKDFGYSGAPQGKARAGLEAKGLKMLP